LKKLLPPQPLKKAKEKHTLLLNFLKKYPAKININASMMDLMKKNILKRSINKKFADLQLS
jgi:hypothetical protein